MSIALTYIYYDFLILLSFVVIFLPSLLAAAYAYTAACASGVKTA